MHPDTVGEFYESLPEEVLASIEVRDAWRRRTAESPGLEFLISELASWPVGSTVRVAFLGGTTELHQKIADATRQITDAANIVLDFGRDAAGRFRTWSVSDTAHAAEIRVSFDQRGFFSLVGTDSTDPTIGLRRDPVGGRPHQRSLNLGGFPNALPNRWQGTVRHEFLHALAFHHEHQNLRGPCQRDFRFEDDPGYVPTLNAAGVFIADAAGRRPGIYTFLSGEPNRWSRAKVDHNLRPSPRLGLVPGEFDRDSVMLYRFDPLFYSSSPSPCAPTGTGIDLSAGDRDGLGELYPHSLQAVSQAARLAEERLTVVDKLPSDAAAGGGLEGVSARSPYQERVLELLAAKAAARP